MSKRIIKYLVMDVDGTLTDGKIYFGANGELLKAFNVKDGYAIKEMLPAASITPVVLTGRESMIVANRCKELGVKDLYQNVSDKTTSLLQIIGTNESLSHVAYIGDDQNDLSVMTTIKQHGGLVGCPADAIQDIQHMSDFISPYRGGDGAVRTFIEWIISLNR